MSRSWDSTTTIGAPARHRARFDGPCVPDHGVGDRATDGMTEERLGLELVEPAVNQPGKKRVARADRIDDLDRGRDCPITPASVHDRDRVRSVGDDTAGHSATMPVSRASRPRRRR